MSNKVNSAKTSPKLAFAYSLGEVGSQMSWYMVNNYLMLFYTDIVGLSASAISLIMLIARVWDAANDPMMGTIADRTKTKWGKFRPYLYFAPPFLAIFNILTFTVFPVQGMAKVILCLICYVGTGMSYTAVNIAYSALQNVIAIDSQVRMNLATARGLGSSVISIILSVCAAPLLLKLSAPGATAADAGGYFKFAIILSVVILPIFWICASGCKETYVDQLHQDDEVKKMSLIDCLKGVFKNDQLMMVVLSTFAGAVCVTGRMGLLTYYIIYCVGDFTVIATVFATMTIAQLIGVTLIPWGTRVFTKKGYLIILQLVMNVGFLLLYFNPNPSRIYLLAVSFLCGLANAAANICYGMVGDALEYGAWKLGNRQEGIVGSMLSFSAKLATALCGSAGVLLLSAVGYVPNAEQTEAARAGINAVVNLIPFFIGTLSLVPMIWYKLTPAKVAEIRADLDAGKHAYDK